MKLLYAVAYVAAAWVAWRLLSSRVLWSDSRAPPSRLAAATEGWKGSGWGFACQRHGVRSRRVLTWLAKPFARWQARSLPCQRSGPGDRRVVSVQDMQNDNKTVAQVSNSRRRFGTRAVCHNNVYPYSNNQDFPRLSTGYTFYLTNWDRPGAIRKC